MFVDEKLTMGPVAFDTEKPPAKSRQRVAMEARKLAAECLSGEGPAFGRGVLFLWGGGGGLLPNCTLGYLLYRCGFDLLDRDLGLSIPRGSWQRIAHTNDTTTEAQRPLAVAPLLLELADALERP